ncbi:MAG: putative ABC transporter permease [Bacilli bacterium]|nr:putative ABC transporter permease [Bacilli bacterium]
MKTFLLYLFLFLVGCMLGYGLEALFRRFVSAKRWVNPGFMKGPWLPLYGFGLITLYTLSNLFISFLPDLPFYDPLQGRGPNVCDLIPMAIMGVAMNLLELFAGLIFVKGFKVRLWDYTNMKGNFMGILCPVFSVIWFALSILYYYAAHPFVNHLANVAYAFMFGGDGIAANFGFIFVLGLAYGIFVVDLVKSLGLFSKITRIARDSGLLTRYEELRAGVRMKKKEAGERFFASLPEKVKEELEKHEDKPLVPPELKQKINEALLIDPNKADSAKENYDESGRPKKLD